MGAVLWEQFVYSSILLFAEIIDHL